MLPSEVDHSLTISKAREQVKAAILAAFGEKYYRPIVTAVDNLITAEVAASKREWLEEQARNRAHNAAVTRAKEEARQHRKRAGQVRRSLEARVCPKCGKSEPEVEFYPDQKDGRPRYQCRQCERQAGADYRAKKKAAEAAAAAEKNKSTAGRRPAKARGHLRVAG